MFKKFHTKQKLFIFTGVFLILIGVYVGIVLWENSYSAKITEIASTARKAAIDSARYKEIVRLVEVTKESRGKISEFLVARDGVVSFIEKLEALAVAANVDASISGVEPVALSKKGNEPTEDLRVVVGMKGSFNGVYHLVSMLETLPYRSRIDRVLVERSGGDEKAPEWRGDVTLYVRKMK